MAVPPTGTITLLFTDIEGSTTRWERQPDAMQRALARHNALLRTAIETHGGYIFKTVGDAFYAAFATAPQALAAALAAQRALHAVDWGAVGPLRVRMALHTGTVDAQAGDYFGPPLNRVARLLAAGHGGQVLLSRVTQDLVRDALPADAALRDLGERRLQDLIRPEQVFQVVGPELPTDFPPLRTLDARPTNLPAQPTPLIGREREIAAVAQRLLQPDVRLVTLTGPGGTGKTRLALQVVADLLDEYQHGVWFVNLAPLSDPALVSSTIAQPLGVTEAGGHPLVESLKHYLHDQQLLLLLDNFEHVLDAAPLVAELLAAAPQVKIVVTSRAVLHLRGEHEYVVPPLALPDPHRMLPLERLTQYEAVRLFIERAQAVKPDFHVTNTNAPAVAEMCVRLDGLPLAIELAAARIKLLPPEALLQRLSNRLKLLIGGPRDVPARQQALRNTIDWSYSLLDPAEQTLFARLAVFVGGGTLDAIEAVCNAAGDLLIDSFDGVASLVDKSLLRQAEGVEGEPRFVMLETIHEYTLERLEASGAAAVVRRQHAEFFLALAEQAEPKLHGPQQVVWLERLEANHDNLRTALQWALEGDAVELGLRLAVALFSFWYIRGYFSEGCRWLETALAKSSQMPTSMRAKALRAAGELAQLQGNYTWATVRLEECLVLHQELGDKRGMAGAFTVLGHIALDQGDYERAITCYEASLSQSRELGDANNTAMLLNKVGYATDLNNLGYALARQGDYVQATVLLEESLALSRELGNRGVIASASHSLGYLALCQGVYTQAIPRFQESLKLSQQLGDRQGIAFDLEGLAGVAAVQGQAERAARLWGTAEVLREAIGAPLPASDRSDYERHVAAARAQVEGAAWQAAWAEGQAMSLDEAVAYALEARGDG